MTGSTRTFISTPKLDWRAKGSRAGIREDEWTPASASVCHVGHCCIILFDVAFDYGWRSATPTDRLDRQLELIRRGAGCERSSMLIQARATLCLFLLIASGSSRVALSVTFRQPKSALPFGLSTFYFQTLDLDGDGNTDLDVC